MNRIMVIGCCGAGKSTLSKKIQDITGLPLYHLDQIYWLPNWTEPTKEVWLEKAAEVVKKEKWIIDGNYGSSMDQRLAYADTVVFLDRSRWTCLWRVTKRILSNYKQKRFDMAEGCYERFDWKFMVYVFHFNDIKKPQILKRLKKVGDKKTIHICKSDKDVDRLLEKLNHQIIQPS